jgi:murein DD-endopeptidase MepM/ murein hydrolase activator NlpD
MIAEKRQQKQNSGRTVPSSSGEMQWPVPSSDCYISSPFGVPHSVTGYHKGLDITCPGANNRVIPIQSALSGEVVDFGRHSTMGNYVVIDHGFYKPKGKEITTTYMHMRSIDSSVYIGADIKKGKVIGIMGTTGNSTGTHLHFQITEYPEGRVVNPLSYVSNPY